jgi:RNA polymerase sigma-70 factor, ECF subfamily
MAVSDWDRIVREHGPTLYATAKRILGHAADAEDTVQEVLIEAHRLSQNRTVRLEGALLRRMAACRALDRLRQRKNLQPLDGREIRDFAQGPPAAAIARELVERLRQALAQLPPREGEVFALRYFEELSYQQIAESLAMQPGAVATALHKARAKLEVLLNEVAKKA